MSTSPTTMTRRERRLAERQARRHAPPARLATRRPGLGFLSVLGLVGGLAVIAIAIALGSRPASPAADPAFVEVASVPGSIPSEGFVLGRSDAPVTIDLYEDFQCPACERWSTDVLPRLAANELSAGTVRIVFHDMAFLGTESTDAGLAAFAAAQQGRFWDMWATLYANQGRENSGSFSRARLAAMAERLGLDMSRFETDMASAAAQAAIDRSRSEAAAAGVSSTPTLIIEGQALVGVQPYTELAAVIASATAQ